MKKYGLQLSVQPSQKKQATRPPLPPPQGFRDDDDDDDNVERDISRHAIKNKTLKDIEEQHKKALEQDPSVFDYDGVYDEMKEDIVRSRVENRQERKGEVEFSHSSGAHRISSVLLNGHNFHGWERSVRLYLGHKGKIDWILGKISTPAESDPTYAKWFTDNCLILSWLFNSMEPSIYDLFMYNDTVGGLWTALTEMYSHSLNEVRVFELYREVHSATQKSDSVTVYFGYLKKRWVELAQYDSLAKLPGMTPDVAGAIRKIQEKHLVYQFLMGLRSEFDAIRTQILNTSPLPTFGQVFALVEKDERRHCVSSQIQVTENVSLPDQMAFAAHYGPHSGEFSHSQAHCPEQKRSARNSCFRNRASPGNHQGYSRSVCQHCKTVGHTKGRCFKLYPHLRQTQRGKARIAATADVSADSSFGSSHIDLLSFRMDQLMSLLTSQHTRGSTSASTPSDMTTSTSGPEFEDDFW